MEAMKKNAKQIVIGAVDIDAAIEESEREIAEGAELVDIDEVFAHLRRMIHNEI